MVATMSVTRVVAAASNTVLIKVRPTNPEALLDDTLRPGVTVTAKIHCGQKPAGYVLFYQAIEYLQKTVFFWWF